MSQDALAAAFAALSIAPAARVSHAPTNSPAAWREALEAHADAPKGFELVKTLVYKPKTAKTATPVPLVIIAREATEVNSGAIGKKLGLKELRFASEDLLQEFFSSDKNSRACLDLSECLFVLILSTVSPFALNSETFPKVLTVIDSTISTADVAFAVRGLSTSQTLFVSGKDLYAYLAKLETDTTSLQDLNFETLKTEAAAAPPAPAKKEKEDAKIEGAVQIAIGIKKEVDFAAWYTNVSAILAARSRMRFERTS